MLRHLLAVPAAALLLAGCGSAEPPPPPQVTFAAGEASTVARPAQYCDVELTQCLTDVAAPVRLAVPPGTPVRVTVPPEIAQTPWQVVFSYADAAGTPTDERSPVFAPESRSDWTLDLGTPDKRLLTAEVQQYGPPPQQNPETGEIEFPIRASWVLNAGQP
ncbi:DUF2771 family protein [Pseudonocardia zijingensis]|uniref:DUF2771 family protein n=1 Tax=Pseudonocardia zijingensis TaxID=153376 RepID=UPI0031D04325